MLVQRTVLTGWLLLVGNDASSLFLRLVTALVVSVFSLAALLVCMPYRRRIDFGLAASGQMLLVCVFLGGILVRLYEDIANDPAIGSPEVAYRFLGLRSSEDAVTMMIIVAFFKLFAFAATLVAQSFVHARQLKLEAKWSCCTLEPPTVRWKLDGIYAAFLSHYKVESASDARYIHDTLRKILRAQIFLDSSSLKDLRHLISEGLCNADVFIMILTDGVLTRPWCLLELFEAKTREIPIVLLNVEGGNFDLTKMEAFITDLQDEMGQSNPAGLELLEQELHPTPLSTLKSTVLEVLQNEFAANNTVLTWNSSAGDRAMLAAFKDLIERMGEVTKRKIVWQPARKGMPLPWAVNAIQHENEVPLSTGIIPIKKSIEFSKGASSDVACVVISETVRGHLTTSTRLLRDNLLTRFTNSQAYYSSASVLAAEIARGVDRPVHRGGDKESLEMIQAASCVVVLLTKNLVVSPRCVAELFTALKADLPLITVLLDQGGYSFEDTRRRLNSDLESWTKDLPNEDLLVHAKEILGDQIDLSHVQKSIYSSITSVIATTWVPHGSRNQFVAAVNDICAQIPPKTKMNGPASPRLTRRRRASVTLGRWESMVEAQQPTTPMTKIASADMVVRSKNCYSST